MASSPTRAFARNNFCVERHGGIDAVADHQRLRSAVVDDIAGLGRRQPRGYRHKIEAPSAGAAQKGRMEVEATFSSMTATASPVFRPRLPEKVPRPGVRTGLRVRRRSGPRRSRPRSPRALSGVSHGPRKAGGIHAREALVIEGRGPAGSLTRGGSVPLSYPSLSLSFS